MLQMSEQSLLSLTTTVDICGVTRCNMQLSVVVPDLVTRIVLSRAERPFAPVIRQRVRLVV